MAQREGSSHGERGGNNQDKIKNYGWNTDLGPIGEQRLLPKSSLAIPSFQRPLYETKVLRIASDFSWAGFGVLLVMRWNGTFYIVDGQHRWAAAMKRSDIVHVPCIVYDCGSEKEGAMAFALANVNRFPVRAVEKFRVLVSMGEPSAILAQELIAQAGWVAGPLKTQFRAIGVLLIQAKMYPDTIRVVWPVVRALGGSVGVQHGVIRGLSALERWRLPGVESIASKRWLDRLRTAGLAMVEESIAQASRYHGGGQRSDAMGIARVINARLRVESRFRFSGQEDLD